MRSLLGGVGFGLWFFSFSTCALAATAEPDLQQSCRFFSRAKPFAYCVYHNEKSVNPDIVYYMHGAGGSEKRWLSHWKPVRDSWHETHTDAPTVISISYGPVWLLAEKSTAKTSGLLEFTLKKNMPFLEKIAEDVTGLKKGRRIIIGESMGGFNTAQMVLRFPDLFARAALLCPAIHEHSPFASRADLQKFASENHATLATAIWETVMERIFFPTLSEWQAAEPLGLGARLLGARTPPLYISNALYDQFGFYAGTRRFAQLATTRGVAVQYEEIEGNHCKFDAATLAAFLAPGATSASPH